MDRDQGLGQSLQAPLNRDFHADEPNCKWAASECCGSTAAKADNHARLRIKSGAAPLESNISYLGCI